MKRFALLFALLFLSCSTVTTPDGVNAVRGFDINRYLGVWYEIARLDHSFERGLHNVTAAYSLRDDGGVDVINRGYDRAAGKWKQAEGRAYLLGDGDEGRLRVSFFRPFYASYNIIALDRDSYSYALVCGPDKSYLWILSRTKRMGDKKRGELINIARSLGFPVDELIIVEHEEI